MSFGHPRAQPAKLALRIQDGSQADQIVARAKGDVVEYIVLSKSNPQRFSIGDSQYIDINQARHQSSCF
jgi:hypothetical protein